MHFFWIFIGPAGTMVFKQFNYLEYFLSYYQNLGLELGQFLMSQILVLCSEAANFKQRRFCSSCLQILQSEISSMGFSFSILNRLQLYQLE